MKMKKLATSALAAALLSATSLAVSAATLTPVQVNGTSFSNLEIGTINISGLSNLTGSLFAADQVGTPWGSFSLDSVTFSGGSIGTTSFTTANFSLSNLVTGAYTVKATGTIGSGGQISDVAFIGAIYEVIPVPEPESYALFLAGLGLMGLVVRRRIH